MKKESFEAVVPEIREYFYHFEEKAFTTLDIAVIFMPKRNGGKIAADRNQKYLINFLVDFNIFN
ncbi:hypothetical protein DET49_10350 [Salegentibacter sp. 24]|jgi:hypothetical protein|uniref:hypothetical protein n=1 Tax=Salegentibacter sp. 24 TaxID=2183986 RepID=UPI00105B72B1|nr:hypothetical protein [Salegentibacter sp. 24]TDN94984.1 hypothetical protein DET49_10350 [Salegentibacter sp. 24]